MAKSVRQKEINFLTVLAGRSGKKKLNPRTFIMPGVLVLLVLIGVGVFALIHSATLQAGAESEAARDYLDSPDTKRLLAEADSVEAEATDALAREVIVALPMQNLATYPDLISANYRQIQAYAGANVELSIMSFDRETGLLTFVATSDYVLSIPTFVSQLRSSGIFVDVSYAGYASNVSASSLSTPTSRTGSAAAGTSTGSSATTSTSEVTLPLYSFSVECSVKPPDLTADTGEEN